MGFPKVISDSYLCSHPLFKPFPITIQDGPLLLKTISNSGSFSYERQDLGIKVLLLISFPS